VKSSYLVAPLLAAMLSSVSLAHAGDQDFTLTNLTGMALGSMYVSPESDSKSWGSDLFKGRVLPNGKEVEIVFSKSNEECKYAIAFKDSEGSEYEIHNVDLCTVIGVKLTKEGSSIAYEIEK
jgi:hypothetical protein